MVCYMFVCLTFFFFFKQKTAYDMRISDWSSDVCSSDLVCVQRSAEAISARRKPPESSLGCLPDCRLPGSRRRIDRVSPGIVDRAPGAARRPAALPGASGRSEEHTSELQSLMRISYAVFCLKKKINIS